MRHGLVAGARIADRRRIADIADSFSLRGARRSRPTLAPQAREEEGGTAMPGDLPLEGDAVENGAALAVAGGAKTMAEAGIALGIQPGKPRQDQPPIARCSG